MLTNVGAHLAPVLPLSLCWRLFHRTLASKLGSIFAGSLVSFIHSVLIVCLIMATDGQDYDIMLWASEGHNSPEQRLVLTISLSYFLHDTLKSGWAGWRLAMLFHHLGGLVFLGVPLAMGRFGACTVQALLFLEASNPCYHARRMLFDRNGPLYHMLDILYFAAFFYLRMVCALILTVDVLINRERMSPFYIWGSVFFQMVSVIFMVLILQHLIIKYFYPLMRRFSNYIAGPYEEKNVTEQ